MLALLFGQPNHAQEGPTSPFLISRKLLILLMRKRNICPIRNT